MQRTWLEVLKGVWDCSGRLGGLLVGGGTQVLVGLLGVQDILDGRGPQALGAVEVEGRVVPGLHDEVADLDLPGAGLGDVLAVGGGVGHQARFLHFFSQKQRKGEGK